MNSVVEEAQLTFGLAVRSSPSHLDGNASLTLRQLNPAKMVLKSCGGEASQLKARKKNHSTKNKCDHGPPRSQEGNRRNPSS